MLEISSADKKYIFTYVIYTNSIITIQMYVYCMHNLQYIFHYYYIFFEIWLKLKVWTRMTEFIFIIILQIF